MMNPRATRATRITRFDELRVEQATNPKLRLEQQFLDEYVKDHYPELKSTDQYVGLLTSNQTNPIRITNIDQLTKRYSVLVHLRLSPRQGRLEFESWLETPHQFDHLILREYERTYEISNQFTHGLGIASFVPRRDQGRRGRISQKTESAYIAELIKDRWTDGIIFFFDDAELARELQDLLNEGEQLREFILNELPEFIFEASSVAAVISGGTLSEITIQALPLQLDQQGQTQIINGAPPKRELIIRQLVYDAVTEYLFEAQEKTENRHYQVFGASLEVDLIDLKTIKQYRRQRFILKQRFIVPVAPELILQEQTQLHQRNYQLALEYGDFELLTRDGIVKAERLKLVTYCTTIERLFLSGVGQSNLRNRYELNDYSKTTVLIFLKAIYEQTYYNELTLTLLPELYDLFFELGCRYQSFDVNLNHFLADHITQIADPDILVESFVTRQQNWSELTHFNRQLVKMYRELTNQNPLTEADYTDIIVNDILPYLKKDYQRSGNRRYVIDTMYDIRSNYMRDKYIGLFPFSTIQFPNFREELNRYIEPVIRAAWSEYPLDRVEIDPDEEDPEFEMLITLHPLNPETRPTYNEADASDEAD